MSVDVASAHSAEAAAEPNVTVLGRAPVRGRYSMMQAFRPYTRDVVLGAVILSVTNALALVVPSLINAAIALVEHGPEAEVGAVFVLIARVLGQPPSIAHVAGLLIVSALLGAVFRTLSRVVLFNVGRDVERDLRSRLFGHLSTLSPTFYSKNPTGDLMSRLTNDLTNIRLMAGFALLNALNALEVFVVTIGLLFGLDWRVALVALIPFPLVMGASQLLARQMYLRTRASQEMLGRLTAHLQENLAGQAVVRAFGQEDKEIARFAETNREAYDVAMRLAVIRIVMFPLMMLMSALGIAIALYLGGRAVIDGRMTIGDVVEFNARLLQLAWPAVAMGFIISVYQRGKAGLDRVNGIFEATPDIVDGAHRGDIDGAVEARGLTLRYPGLERPALEALSFSVEAGGTLGIVGRNASGKSTVVRALARMLPVDEGMLFVDDVDVVRWHRADLHRSVAVVTDDGFLFSATLRENICFARPDATDAEVAEALELADLKKDVETFPDGLDTVVGERGVTLSGGQKQRVALARALMTRPKVLVLDDSLSAVDAETEARIVGALRAGKLPGGPARAPTLIVVSHRLSAVRETDEILVLEEGALIERGTHDALLKEGGRYADLWGREQLLKALEGEGGAP